MSRRRHPLRPALFSVATLALAAAVTVTGAPAQADGGTIKVAPDGMAGAVRAARPGDTIIVSEGTVTGAVGYGAGPGRADAPIRLMAAPGARVTIKGTLQLENADYWTVSGINVTRDPDAPITQFLVKFDGGTGWRFANAEVWGGKGASNVMVSASDKNGTPGDYKITGNCIHDNDAEGGAFMNDHLIYLMPGYDAGQGLIEHNIFFDAPNGAAVKAAGPTAATGAGRVAIRSNTIVRTAAGVIIGHASHHIRVDRNAIGQQVKKPPAGASWVANYRAAVIGNHVTGGGNRVARNVVWGFAEKVWATKDSTARISTGANPTKVAKYDSTAGCGDFKPENATAQDYGNNS